MSSDAQTSKAWFWLVIAEWFGSGRLPKAPGTFGSLAALPLAFLLSPLGLLPYWIATLGLTGLGTIAAERASAIRREKDPQSVVIDEVIGVLLAFGFLIEGPLWGQILAFLLFRLLDITKPGPIFHLQSLKPNGLGIMADDVAAGLLAGALARGLVLLVEGL